MTNTGQTGSEEAKPHLFCAYCGTEDQADYGYCDHCGEKVETPDDIRYHPKDLGYCPECNAANQIRARHCVGCGILLDDYPLVASAWKADNSAQDAAYPDPDPDYPGGTTTEDLPPDITSQIPPAPPETPVFTTPRRPSLRDVGGRGRGVPYRSRRTESESDRSEESDPWGEPDPNAEPNTSGEPDAVLPPELEGFNWGALILAPIWGVANKTWVVTPLFTLWILPVSWQVGLPIYIAGSIYVGFQANELAWRAKAWKSVGHFQRIQQTWAFWGFIASPIVLLGLITVPFGIWS